MSPHDNDCRQSDAPQRLTHLWASLESVGRELERNGTDVDLKDVIEPLLHTEEQGDQDKCPNCGSPLDG